VIALEAVQLELVGPQAVVLAPTREIANQICAVIATIGAHCPGLKCASFIGGTPLAKDHALVGGCHIVVGIARGESVIKYQCSSERAQ
jgi:superfamily II DNA/RNA helicase